MRLAELHLKAFGPFTDLILHLGVNKQRLVLVHGLNEAGKSSALRAIAGLRFGIRKSTDDAFLHEYKEMRVGGVFVDSEGKQYPLMRRKGTGVTLRFADFTQGGMELSDPIPGDIHRLLTGGLSVDDYQSMFGLDHDSLRKGGKALVKGEGEIGAALFEASSGVDNVSRILTELDTTAKKFFMTAAHAKHGRINQALSEYKSQAEQYKDAQIKPTRWEATEKASREASANFHAIQHERNQYVTEQALLKELIAVAPILITLERASIMLAELDQTPLLAENASTERVTAEAGLSDALADISTQNTTIREQRDFIASLDLDPAILAISESVSRLHAGIATITQLRMEVTISECDVTSFTQALNALSIKINPELQPNEVIHQAPTSTGRTQITETIVALEQAQRALTQHRLSVPDQISLLNPESETVPDTNLQAAVRVALAEVVKNNAMLLRLGRLPNEIKAAQRKAEAALAIVNLPDAQAARRVRPLLGAAVNEASKQLTALDSKRTGKVERVEKMQTAISEKQDAIKDLLAEGLVPTRDEVHNARAHRQEGWALVKATYIDVTNPDLKSFTLGRPLPEVYENAVSEADTLIDGLASETERATNLEGARRELDTLNNDLTLQKSEIQSIDTQQESFETKWEQTLAQANIPIMPPAELRDWQDLLTSTLSAIDGLQGKRDELLQAQDIEKSIADKLIYAISQLGISKVKNDDPLDTLVAVAEDDLRQIDARIAARNNALGQTTQLKKQVVLHNATDADLVSKVQSTKQIFSSQVCGLMLNENATVAMAKSRLAEFDEILLTYKSVVEATSKRTQASKTLSIYQEMAQNISDTLSEHLNEDIILAAEIWSTRSAKGQSQQSKLDLAEHELNLTTKALANNEAKEARHRATLTRLCASAAVKTVAEVVEVEGQSKRKHQAIRDVHAATEQLTKASRRSIIELKERLAGREYDELSMEESNIEQKLEQANVRLDQARAAEEMARRALEDISSSDVAAAASDAMARAAATVRNTLPLQIRTRLAHVLLQEAVRRFKERSQAPMLKSASEYFVQITGNEFEKLINDDSGEVPVIAAKRPNGEILSTEAMSEGTRDQLYLALRLAALKLQRDRGVDLPVILDDVLMASDDVRAGCIFKALANFSKSGQVIIFTHHHHLCDVARQNVDQDIISLVEIKRTQNGSAHAAEFK
ncbi:MAG: AAA family ATPase [Nitrosospira sp.]